MQTGGGSMIFVRGGRVRKKLWFIKRGGSGEFEHCVPSFELALLPLNNDQYLTPDFNKLETLAITGNTLLLPIHPFQ